MTERLTRNEAIAAECRECTYDSAAVGTWREQVSVCGCVSCPLWPYRPLASSAPAWIKSRAHSDLPEGFRRLRHDEAIAQLRGIDAKAADSSAQLQTQTVSGGGATQDAARQ